MLEEKLPNTKGMNKKSDLAVSEGGIITAPAYSEPGHRILDDLRRRVNLSEGYDIAFKRIRKMFGLAKTTTSDWFNQSQIPAVQLLFGLLERLPEGERSVFVQKFCRTLPSLEHAALAHEPAIVDHLRTLLSRPAGLTLISGFSDYARHFLLCALAHSFSRHDAMHRPIAGLICKSPGRLVPLDEVFYLATDSSQESVIQHVHRLWPKIRDADTPMVVLDGVWLRVPAKRLDILKLALSKHVLLADEFSQGESPSTKENLLYRLQVSGSPATALNVQIRR